MCWLCKKFKLTFLIITSSSIVVGDFIFIGDLYGLVIEEDLVGNDIEFM